MSAALTALAVGLPSAALAWWFYRGRRRKRAAAAKSKLQGPSLAEELREALRREAEQDGTVLDAEALQVDFETAVEWVGGNGGELSTSAKLALYGCYKQATVGDCPPDCPRGIEASYKWKAWKEHAGSPRAEAMRKYVATLRGIAPSWVPPSGPGGAILAPPPDSEEAEPNMSLGPSVSTLGRIGGEQGVPDDVDETPVGQLNEMIHQGDVGGALAVLKSAPDLAFKADKDGMTPLHWAADRGCDQVMDALLAMLGNGAEAVSRLNACDHNGDTALHYSIMAESEGSAKKLFNAGADVNISNEDGETPLKLAEEQGWEKLFTK